MNADPAPDPNLVVVCHCKIHSQIFTVKDGNLYRPLGPTVTYVDTDERCKDNTWDKIANSSKKYVWAFNCPVYPAIERGGNDMYTDILLNILDESYRVLDLGGHVIVGLYYDPSEKIIYNLRCDAYPFLFTFSAGLKCSAV